MLNFMGSYFLDQIAAFFPNIFLKQVAISVCRFSIPAIISEISDVNKISLSTWFVLTISLLSWFMISQQMVHLFSQRKWKKNFPLILMTSSVIDELIKKKKISQSSGLDKGEKRKYCSASGFWGCPSRCHGSVMLRMCASNHLLIFISSPSSRSWQGPVWKAQWINNDILDCWGLCNRAKGLCILRHDDTTHHYANFQTSYWRRHSHAFSLSMLWRGP